MILIILLKQEQIDEFFNESKLVMVEEPCKIVYNDSNGDVQKLISEKGASIELSDDQVFVSELGEKSAKKKQKK